MSIYKLVVISPFNDYNRGDQIVDPAIVSNILNTEHPMNNYESKCRKVFKSEAERQMYVAPVTENEAPADQTPKTQELEKIEVESSEPINIESIKSDLDNEDN